MLYVESDDIYQQELALDVIKFCYDELLDDEEIELLVEIKDKLDCGCNGFCTQLSLYDYEIEIDRTLNQEDFIKTICHEMVHVKQGVKKELIKVSGESHWRGKEYTSDLPWEKEAYHLENILFNKFINNDNRYKTNTGLGE